MKNMGKLLLVAVVSVFFVMGCQSKKKAGEESTVSDSTRIESEAMSFDPSGSDSGSISGLNTVFFEFDKSTLTAQAKQTLAKNAEWMKRNANVNMQIEGHCDNRGSIEYNLALGERRAQATKNYMVSLGISGNRISVISYGEEKPLAMGETEAAHSKNRRANFVPLAQ